MTTDEMILALVERHGFVLPEGLHRAVGLVCSRWWTEPLVTGGVNNLITDQQAHDLCACEFARRVKARGETHSFPSMELGETFRQAMYYGDSAAAIEALYEAVESQQPNAQADPATEPQR